MHRQSPSELAGGGRVHRAPIERQERLESRATEVLGSGALYRTYSAPFRCVMQAIASLVDFRPWPMRPLQGPQWT
eukprot:scaffold155351_cov31-Tisochrysis_lutea.AAC.2